MRILMMNPALSNKFPNGRELIHDVDLIHLPMGILYLAGVAIQGGHDVRVVDMPVSNMGWAEVERIVDEFRPHMAGITTMTATFPNAMRCARIAKAVGARVVMGGPHVTFEFAEALSSDCVDYVIKGEGEQAFASLLQMLVAGQEPGGQVRGLIARPAQRARDRLDDNGATRFRDSPLPKRIRNLDGIPLPPYDLLDMKHYVELEALGIHTSRGCPYRCDFCTIQGQWGRQVTWRSADEVAREMSWLVDRYDYRGREFIFYDDTFTVNRGHVLDICDSMKRWDVDVRWKAMTRVDRVDAELLQRMKRSGCFRVIYGIETTNDESLAKCGKDTHIRDVFAAVRMAKEAGLEVAGYFIIGFPWETRDDMFRVIDAMGELELDEYGLAMLAPYPGTPYFDHPERFGITIPDRDWERFNHLLPVIESKNFTRKDQAEAFVDYLCQYVID